MMRKAVCGFYACFEKTNLETEAIHTFLKLTAFARAAKDMKKKCPNCRLINFPHLEACARCQCNLVEVSSLVENQTKTEKPKFKFLRRALVCVGVCLLALAGFYLSLIFTSAPLTATEKTQIERAIDVLDEKNFSREVFLLRHLTKFRSNDNWLNASTRLENAYAATNYPVEIMTIYPEFFTVSVDDTERAAILLHEAQHLKGADEKQAYQFVWLNRKQLGWTKNNYDNSLIWRNVRKQTAEVAPNLFVCYWMEVRDCTE